MDYKPDDIEYAIENSHILREPDRRIDTFGVTRFKFLTVSVLMDNAAAVRIRSGEVEAQKPTIIKPSGFNDMSVDTCRVENPMGSVNCDFVLTTPSNLQSKWEGCLIVVDEMTDPIWSCSSEFAFSLTVNEKETVVPSVGIDVNGTFLEELGVTEENQNLVIGGAAGGLILVASLYAFFRRKV